MSSHAGLALAWFCQGSFGPKITPRRNRRRRPSRCSLVKTAQTQHTMEAASPDELAACGATPLSDKKLMRGVAVNGWRIESSEDHILDTRQLLLVRLLLFPTRTFAPKPLPRLRPPLPPQRLLPPPPADKLTREPRICFAALDAAGQSVPERLRGAVLRARLVGQPQAVRLRLRAGDGCPHGALKPRLTAATAAAAAAATASLNRAAAAARSTCRRACSVRTGCTWSTRSPASACASTWPARS